MIASGRDQLESERQTLLTFRLSTVIVVLTALLAWMIADRYLGLGDADEAGLETPTTSPLKSEADKNPACSAEAASKTQSAPWAVECRATDSKIETPATTKVVAGSKTKTL
jgi:hypothetical protein